MVQAAERTLEQLYAMWGGPVDGPLLHVDYGDSAALDAFSRLRVSNPDTLFEAKFVYDDGPRIFDTLTTSGGSATYISAESAIRMRVDGTNGARVVRQSHGYMPYQPGKSQSAFLTFALGATAEDVTKSVGYFDDDNGLFLEETNTAVRFVRRTSTSGTPVDVQVEQASWNLDTLDGSGDGGNPSRQALDLTKTQILVIDLQWLGVGRVRLGFDIDGMVMYCHEFLNANVLTTVYIRTAALPIRYELVRTAAGAGNTDLIQLCSTVLSEGGVVAEKGLFFAAGNGVTPVTAASGAMTPIASIRPALLFGGITNRVPIMPTDISIMGQTNPIVWEVILNGALTGASFSAVDATSAVEVDVAASAIAGGIVVASEYVAVSGPGSARAGLGGELPRGNISLALDIAGSAQDVLTLAAAGIGGTSPTYAQAQWRELQ